MLMEPFFYFLLRKSIQDCGVEVITQLFRNILEVRTELVAE